MSMANMVSHTFLTRHTSQIDDSSAFLKDIRQETHLIKYWNLGMSYNGCLALAAKIPGLLAMAFSGHHCIATAVLSNLGNPVRHFHQGLPSVNGRVKAGNVVLRRITGAPPVRPKTHAVFMVIEYAGELTVCVRCDPKLFCSDDSKQLLALYIDLLKKTVE